MKSLYIALAFLICFSSILVSDPTGVTEKTSNPEKYSIKGRVVAHESGEPIAGATVQVVGEHRAIPTNADGYYRLVLNKGNYQIKVSHVGHYSEKFAASLMDSSITVDVNLKSLVIDLGIRTVHTSDYNPAERIIEAAIARKKDILSQFHDYSYDAHAKFVLRDGNKPDSQSIMFIVESQTTSFWENPDKYKEIIRARRQSANMAGKRSILIVGEMLNFNRNRLEIGDYSVVTPTANDAREYYEFRLIDTVYYDERPAFVLEFIPRNEYEPLLEGEVHILDSTYEVARVEGRLTKGVSFTGISNLCYYQQLAAIVGEKWLPVQIGITADVEMRFPGLPPLMKLEYVASIFSYEIDQGIPPGTFDEYLFEVDDDADKVDSSIWAGLEKLPLTDQEMYGYRRIDSLEKAPKPIWKALLRVGLGAALVLTQDTHDFFRYNRVEGAYTGLGLNLNRIRPGTEFHLRGGYAFDDKNWEYRFGIKHYLRDSQKFWVSGHIKDEVVHRPTIISGDQHDATFGALFYKEDPLDYYREKGYELGVGVKLFRYLRLRGGYNDFDQYSKSNSTNHALFATDKDFRPNPEIKEGNLRSFTGSISYDSRKLIKSGREEFYITFPQYTKMTLGGEYASPDLIDNDYYFKRYYFQYEGRYRLPRLGMLDLFSYLGASQGILPPQRQFIVDFNDPYMYKKHGMNTTGENNFGGDRVALVYGQLDFGPYLFRNSGISFLKGIPMGLSLHGGAMWCDFHYSPVDNSLMVAKMPYTELGFGINNLSPFLAPFNLSFEFTWQLSTYATNDFEFGFDFGF